MIHLPSPLLSLLTKKHIYGRNVSHSRAKGIGGSSAINVLALIIEQTILAPLVHEVPNFAWS